MEFLEIYRRFFREEEEEKGYQNGLEYFSDWIQLLDAYIFAAFEQKRLKRLCLEESGFGGTGIAVPEIQELVYPEIISWEDAGFREFQESEFKKIKRHIKRRLEASEDKAAMPLFHFSSVLKLSFFQQLCLILGAAVLTDQKYAKLFACLLDSQTPCYPTKGLALFLYEMTEALGIEEYQELVFGSRFYSLCFQREGAEEENVFWALSPLVIRTELFSYFLGRNVLSETMKKDAWLYDSKKRPEKILVCRREKEQLLNLMTAKTDRSRLIAIIGKKGSGKKFLLTHLGYETGQNILFLDGKRFFSLFEQKGEELLWILRLELLIKEAVVCLCDMNIEKEECPQFEKLLERLAAGGVIFFLTADEPPVFSQEQCFEKYELFLPRPSVRKRVLLWQYFMGFYQTALEGREEVLASCYALNAGEIRELMQTAQLQAQSQKHPVILEADVAEALKRRKEGLSGGFADRIEAVFTWEDLVVQEGVLSQLRNIANQVKYRSLVGEEWGFYEKRPYGRGICALFYGPPGTGKTMAVQVLANDLGLALYRVNLSRMLSKYIGETQKNISALFEQVRESNALLFFDEADAFFSKRTEVGNANDRNANGETAHLLQCLEEYEGISILATNLKDNMDDAYKRRIRFMVHFQAPDVGIRKKLWKKLIPDRAPVDNLQLDFFAERFELTGSEIKDIIWNGAFLAAAEGTEIKNRHIAEAVKQNYEKYGRTLTKEELDFGDY